MKKLTTAVPRGVATPKAKAAFNERFEAMLGEETVRNLAKAWIDFAGRLDYGYDARRSRIDDFTPGTPLGEKTATCTVHADRGWQNSAIRLEAGEHIRIEAAGRFQLDDRPGPWIAEPNGITLKYHDGRPVGMLLATVLTDEQDEYVEAEPGETGTGKAERSVPSGFAFLRPVAVGSARAWTPPRSGTLYFRVNDSPADLANNKGNIKVTVESYPVGDP
ncbi:MAG TPA: hypothetical protein DEB39_09325 [Planctomycetaceae bacterium]|nr:hypothetical protein [Planctomycetaceae bacterium]